MRFGVRKIQRAVKGFLRFALVSKLPVKFTFRGVEEGIAFGLAIQGNCAQGIQAGCRPLDLSKRNGPIDQNNWRRLLFAQQVIQR